MQFTSNLKIFIKNWRMFKFFCNVTDYFREVKNRRWKNSFIFICSTSIKNLPFTDHSPITFFISEENFFQKTFRRLGLSETRTFFIRSLTRRKFWKPDPKSYQTFFPIPWYPRLVFKISNRFSKHFVLFSIIWITKEYKKRQSFFS